MVEFCWQPLQPHYYITFLMFVVLQKYLDIYDLIPALIKLITYILKIINSSCR